MGAGGSTQLTVSVRGGQPPARERSSRRQVCRRRVGSRGLMDQFKGFFTKDDEGPVVGPNLGLLWVAVGLGAVVILAVWVFS